MDRLAGAEEGSMLLFFPASLPEVNPSRPGCPLSLMPADGAAVAEGLEGRDSHIFRHLKAELSTPAYMWALLAIPVFQH